MMDIDPILQVRQIARVVHADIQVDRFTDGNIVGKLRDRHQDQHRVFVDPALVKERKWTELNFLFRCLCKKAGKNPVGEID
jgi:hypothetical protein